MTEPIASSELIDDAPIVPHPVAEALARRIELGFSGPRRNLLAGYVDQDEDEE